MGVVKFKVGDEEIGFEIKGDKPTFSEQLKIITFKICSSW